MARFEFFSRFARNRGALVGACVILLVALVAVLAPLLFPADPLRIVGTPELWPGEDPAFPLGTDSLGRDIAGHDRARRARHAADRPVRLGRSPR